MDIAAEGRARASALQRDAADPSASVWVAASAGTGKTHVLIQRILRLLLDGAAPERILCLTFTRAAAAEMANRLHGRLGAWATLGDDLLQGELHHITGMAPTADDLARARRLFARVLEARGGLKIQTIHGFCEALLRRFPLEAELPPHFKLMDERVSAERQQAALEQVLRREAASPEGYLAAITALIDETAVTALVASLLSERGRLEGLRGEHGVARLMARLRRHLGLAEGEDETAILGAASKEAAFDGAEIRKIAEAMAASDKSQDKTRSAPILAWLEQPTERVALFDAYLGSYLTAKGEPFAKMVTKSILDQFPDADDILRREAERLLTVQERRRKAQLAAATEALLHLTRSMLTAYEAEKQWQAALDYDDLILRTRRLLSSSAAAQWVLYKLDMGLDHILVDEAQDTNPEQWQVIRALADEFFAGEGGREDARRTIFVVGDAKQSIYSFQRADPVAYGAMQRYFEERVTAAREIWRPIPLNRSFRSTEAVLGCVDAVFAAPAAADGLSFDLEDDIRHEADRLGQAGLVELWPPELPQDRDAEQEDEAWRLPVEQETISEPVQRLAERIARLLHLWFQRGEQLPALNRAVRPGDVLILVQKRAPFVEAMVRELKRMRIPVAGVDRMVLTDQLAVMDLMALGHALLLPEDDLTLATVLKSPLVGLDDDDLFALAHGREGSLWEALATRRAGNASFEAAYLMLSRLLARIDYVPPFEFYAELLGAGGGRRRLLSRLGPDANDPIDEFLSLALSFEADHPPTMQAFLHWLAAAETEVKREHQQQRDEVRVMTVHGAKGLEAPVVFLADTCRVPTGDRGPLYWLDDARQGADLPLWRPFADMADAVTRAAAGAAQHRQMQEYHRLLYVAMTRARDRLYVCGFEGRRARDPGCWYDLAAAAIRALGEQVALEPDGEGWRISSPQTAPPPEPAATAVVGASAALPAWVHETAPPESRPPRPLAPSRPAAEEPAGLGPRPFRRVQRFRRGSLIHRLLQTLPLLPPDDRVRAAERYLAMPTHNLDAEAQAEIRQAAFGILDTAEFAALFGPDSRAEVALAGVVGEQVISGQVDRLVVTADTVIVADYKTNRPAPSEPAAVAELYLRQMAAYRALLRGIYPDRTVHCLLVWTDGPRLMRLDDALLAPYAP